MAALKIGDRITFRVQGVPLDAVVSSIRRRTDASPRPFFYFVFPDRGPREGAADGLRGGPGPEGGDHPGAEPRGGGLPERERRRRRGRGGAGCDADRPDLAHHPLLHAARDRRGPADHRQFGARHAPRPLLEAVHYRILGARSTSSRFVLQVFALEGALVGLASGLLALVFAQAITWGIATWRLNLRWHPFWASSLAVVARRPSITVGVGLAASLPVLRRRPADFLRSADDESANTAYHLACWSESFIRLAGWQWAVW